MFSDNFFNQYENPYGFNNQFNYNQLNYRAQDFQFDNSELISLSQALNLIKTSVLNEKEDELFYDLLIKQAPTDKEKNIIKSIRDDEKKHNQILRRIYYESTGQMLPDNMNNLESDNSGTLDYKSNLEKALFGELEAVKKYRKILGTMPSGDFYVLIMSIMTDELIHSSKYNYLIHIAK